MQMLNEVGPARPRLEVGREGLGDVCLRAHGRHHVHRWHGLWASHFREVRCALERDEELQQQRTPESEIEPMIWLRVQCQVSCRAQASHHSDSAQPWCRCVTLIGGAERSSAAWGGALWGEDTGWERLKMLSDSMAAATGSGCPSLLAIGRSFSPSFQCPWNSTAPSCLNNVPTPCMRPFWNSPL